MSDTRDAHASGDGPAAPTAGISRAAAGPYVRIGGLLLLAALAYLVWRIVTPLWQPLLWAMLLGALLSPLNLRLTRRLRGRAQLSSAIMTLLTVLLFILPVVAAAGAVAAQAAHLLRRIEVHVADLGEGAKLDLERLPWLAEGVAWLDANLGVSLLQLQGWLTEGLRRLLQVLVSSGGSAVMSALGTAVSFVVMLFVLFFVLRDGPALARQVVRMLPIEDRRRALLWQHLEDVTRAVFLGIGLTALAQGVLLGVGFRIAGLPSPLVFGVLGVILALIPMVGPALLWIPAALWLGLRGEHGHAIFLAAWGAVVVGLVDNFLRPLLISGRAEVPTLAVFVGVMGGLAAFGFIGLFVGPIVLGLLVALFRFEAELNAGADRGR
jgi:predicted PurR-regulated permease PerM